jgi:hypothetical protein
VEGELALIDGVLHKGEGQQVAQGPVDRFFLTERALLLEVLLFAVSDNPTMPNFYKFHQRAA